MYLLASIIPFAVRPELIRSRYGCILLARLRLLQCPNPLIQLQVPPEVPEPNPDDDDSDSEMSDSDSEAERGATPEPTDATMNFVVAPQHDAPPPATIQDAPATIKMFTTSKKGSWRKRYLSGVRKMLAGR